MPRAAQVVPAIGEYLGDVYCVKMERCIAELAIDAYPLSFFDQGIEITATKGAQNFRNFLPGAAAQKAPVFAAVEPHRAIAVDARKYIRDAQVQ
jgi:hypothetical protein